METPTLRDYVREAFDAMTREAGAYTPEEADTIRERAARGLTATLQALDTLDVFLAGGKPPPKPRGPRPLQGAPLTQVLAPAPDVAWDDPRAYDLWVNVQCTRVRTVLRGEARWMDAAQRKRPRTFRELSAVPLAKLRRIRGCGPLTVNALLEATARAGVVLG